MVKKKGLFLIVDVIYYGFFFINKSNHVCDSARQCERLKVCSFLSAMRLNSIRMGCKTHVLHHLTVIATLAFYLKFNTSYDT